MGKCRGAESRNDFVHKLAVVLKELKECRSALKIIMKKALIKPVSKLEDISKETEERIAIMAKSIDTANKNKLSKTKDS
jgi:four helix bundle protein